VPQTGWDLVFSREAMLSTVYMGVFYHLLLRFAFGRVPGRLDTRERVSRVGLSSCRAMAQSS